MSAVSIGTLQGVVAEVGVMKEGGVSVQTGGSRISDTSPLYL